MASEKQVNFINALIEKMQPENHPAWRGKDNYVDEADRLRGLRRQQGLQRQEMIKALDLENFDTDGMSDDEIIARYDQIESMDYDAVMALYQAKLDELSNRDWASVDSRTASQAIDSLKQYRFPKF